MKTKQLIATVLIVLIASCPMVMNAQFHAGIDFKLRTEGYTHTANKDVTIFASQLNVMATGIYDFTPQISAGAGIGITSGAGFNITAPIFATMRYSPIKKHTNAYIFTNLGYAPKYAEDIPQGWIFDAGIGYRLMFRKHFGLNFQLAYNLQQFVGDMRVTNTNDSMGIGQYYQDIYGWPTFDGDEVRHFVSLSIGFVF